MNTGLIQIREQRGRLIERAARQREDIAHCVAAFAAPVAVADRGMAIARFLRAYPAIVAAATALMVVLKPRRSFSWLRRGFALWQTWRWLAARLT